MGNLLRLSDYSVDMSDQWTVGPIDCRINGLSDQWIVGPSELYIYSLLVGPMNCRPDHIANNLRSLTLHLIVT